MLYLQNNIHYVQRHRAIKVNKITVHKKIRGAAAVLQHSSSGWLVVHDLLLTVRLQCQNKVLYIHHIMVGNY
jgi:hypothetical protein